MRSRYPTTFICSVVFSFRAMSAKNSGISTSTSSFFFVGGSSFSQPSSICFSLGVSLSEPPPLQGCCQRPRQLSCQRPRALEILIHFVPGILVQHVPVGLWLYSQTKTTLVLWTGFSEGKDPLPQIRHRDTTYCSNEGSCVG